MVVNKEDLKKWEFTLFIVFIVNMKPSRYLPHTKCNTIFKSIIHGTFEFEFLNLNRLFSFDMYIHALLGNIFSRFSMRSTYKPGDLIAQTFMFWEVKTRILIFGLKRNKETKETSLSI